MLTDLDAADVRLDWPEFAAKFDGGVGLHVPGVDGAKAAVQEQEDERNIACRLTACSRVCLRMQDLRQCQAHAEDAGGAHVDKIAASDAVAETFLGHDIPPLP